MLWAEVTSSVEVEVEEEGVEEGKEGGVDVVFRGEMVSLTGVSSVRGLAVARRNRNLCVKLSVGPPDFRRLTSATGRGVDCGAACGHR
ncbi:hypothetical protein GCM10010428_48130 [Actinosynnema pretiosum subsp. pretiosum]